MHTHDVAIIGAGPIGIELAVALKRAGLDFVHLDAGQVGATMQWWAPGTKFFSSPERIAIAGVPLTTRDQEKATREEYLAYLRAVVEQFDLRIRTYERVVGIERRSGEGTERRRGEPAFELRTRGVDGEHAYRARRVVLAMGDMHGPRTIGVPGEDLPHVDHYLRDPHVYFRRKVLIVGGRNSAVEAAIRLYRVGADVSISYRRSAFDPERIKYWLLPEINWLIAKGKIGFHPRTVVERIEPGRVVLHGCGEGGEALPSADPGARATVEAEQVLLLTGYVQDPTLFRLAGVELEGENLAPAHNPHTMETNVPGIYVAGTAAAGTQHRFKLFIETAHVHVDRILAAITGAMDPLKAAEQAAALAAEREAMPES